MRRAPAFLLLVALLALAGGPALAGGATAADGATAAGGPARGLAGGLAAIVPGPSTGDGPAVLLPAALTRHAPAAAPVPLGPVELAEPAEAGVDWLRVLTKAVTYETLGSFLEAGVFLAFFGGGAGTAGAIFGAAMLGAGAVYVVHEYAWEALLAPEVPRADPALVMTKTITYRALSMARSFATGSILGGAGAVSSGGYAVTLALLDSGLYALTEFAFAWWQGDAAGR